MINIVNIRETRARRDTLNPCNIMALMTVRVMSESNEMRLVSLTSSEYNNTLWLHYLKSSKMSYFEVPKQIKPNQAPPTNFKCEDDYTELEEKTDDSKTPQDFIEFMTNPKSETSYVSIPIYNNIALNKISQLSSRFTETPYPMRFLHINSVDFDITGLSSTVIMEFFIYQKGPITEPVQMNFNSSDARFTRFKYFSQKQDLILPFPESEDSLFVCVIYMPFPDVETGGQALTPIGVGYTQILGNADQRHKRNCKLQGVITPSFTRFDATIPFAEHFTRPSDMPYKIKFNYSIQINIDNLEASQPIITRLTSFRSMIPTPLLTFYDFSVNLKIKLNSKKALQRQAYIKITLKMPNENGKLVDVKLFAGITEIETTESGSTSRITPRTERIYFPEHLNFLLSTEIDQPITAQIDIILSQPGNSKTVASTTIPINRSFQSFTDHKMDSKGNLISFKYSYPSIFAPPRLLRDVLVGPWNASPDISKDPIYASISPFAIRKYLEPERLQSFDFQKFFNLFPQPEKSNIQTWIEHYFDCNKEFSRWYLEKLTQSIKIAVNSPFPFFLLLFKALAIDKKFDESLISGLNKLLFECVGFANLENSQGEKLRETIADFVLRLRAVFIPKTVFSITFNFLFKLTNYARLHVYSLLLSDIAFVQSITFNFRFDLKKNQSPYIPLISLFYKTLHLTFIDNKKVNVNLAVSSLSVLSTTLEGFCDSETASEIVHIIFPILPMIFTFYDSLTAQLNEGNASTPEVQGGSILMPIILFILRYCDGFQFLNYFELLSSDSQLRFLDFLCQITDDQMIHSITKSAPPGSVTELALTHEITFRILIFLGFFDKINNLDERIIHSTFNLILHMLKSTKQPSDSYALLFKTIAFFIGRDPTKIFSEKTALLSQLLSATVELTQRKCYNARTSAIAFIIWLIELESKDFKDTPRCAMLLQSVTCKVFLKNKTFLPFFEHLPESVAFDQVKNLYEMLKSAMEPTINDNKVRTLLEIANNHYKNFPAIRARILSQVVELNKANGDVASAFIAQWRLCGFISEVFKLKNQIVDGIPKQGIKAFPFIFEEPQIDLSIYPENSAYIAIDSEMFTETYICQAMQEAIVLCKQAGFNKLISKVTEYLFDNLEKRREFDLLKQLYESVSQSYAVLNASENPRVEFSRVFLGPELAEKFGFTEAIRISPIKPEKIEDQDYQSLQMFSTMSLIDSEPDEIDDIGKYEQLLKKEGGKKSKSQNPLDSATKENEFQIIKVHYDPIQFNQMHSSVFNKNILAENENEIDWNETLVKRITYLTESPLPHPISYSKITKTNSIEITKHDYYIEKLHKFIESFKQQAESLSSVLPPEKMLKMWAQCTLGLNTSPILSKIGKIVLAQENPSSKSLVYLLVLRLNVPEEKKHHKKDSKVERESENEKDRDKEKGKDKEKGRSKEKGKEKSKDKDKEKSKDKDKDKEKSKDKEKEKSKEKEKDKEKEKEKDREKIKINTSNVPKDIVELSDSIWKMLRDSIHLIDKVFDLTKPSDMDMKRLAKFREILNVPITVQKVYRL